MIGETAVIIGGGAMGVDFHLPRLSRMCGAGAIHVVDPDPRRLDELRDKFRDRLDLTLTHELPADVRYSYAVVATPAKFHGEYVERLSDRCAKLVVEKPIARTLAEAEAIVDQFERSDATGFVCHIRRTLESFRFAKQLVADGLFGDLQSVSVREGYMSGKRSASVGAFSRDLSGGGVLLDMGSHTLDLLFQVFDELRLKRAWVDADVRRSRKAIEANCVLELEGDAGVAVEVVLSMNRRLSNKAEFRFSRAVLTLDVADNTLALAMAPGGRRLHGVAGDGHARKMDLDDAFDAFYRQYVSPGVNDGVSPRDSLKIMRIIEEAYGAASIAERGF